MKISFSPKSLLFTAALLISAGTSVRLAAQTPVNEITVPSLTPIVVTARSYSGTATQTTKAGVTTTGTFTLTAFKGGNLSATTVFNGVSTTYDGALPKVSSGGIKGTRAGYILVTVPVQTNVDGSVSYAAIIIPLLVDRSVARGGFQNADGSVLTFYAERDATINGGH